MSTHGERPSSVVEHGREPDSIPMEAERRERTFTVWSEDLALGVETIDEQHRRICEAVANLREGMKSKELWRLPGVLQALQVYADVHFTTEEAEMARAGYPGLRAHHDAHAKFAAQLQDHQLALSCAVTPSAVLELSSWLAVWVREHIRTMDGELGRFLRGQQAPPSGPRRRGPGGAG